MKAKATMKLLVVLIVLGLALSAQMAQAAQIKTANVTVTVNKDGGGFIDAVQFKGKEVVKAPKDFIGGRVCLAAAGNGPPSSLFANALAATLPAKITEVQESGNTLLVKGSYTDGKVSIPFTRQINLKDDNTIQVKEETDFSGLDGRFVVARHSLELPLAVCEDDHCRNQAFGGEKRVEMIRMNGNDVRGINQNISDNRAYVPYWDIGGVLQMPDSYRVWKANHADTLEYPIEQGRTAPAWADYSESDWGLTAAVADPQKAAPWAMQIDARKGIFTFSPHPASQLASSGKDLGKRTFQFSLTMHPSSWPTKYPCELDLGLYEKLLERLIKTESNLISNGLGTLDVPVIVHRMRIQPSIILRLLYRDDASHMQNVLKTIGKNVPREQSMDKWEVDAKEYLDYLRKNGLPADTSKTPARPLPKYEPIN